MRRLLPALLLLAVAGTAWGHPMPNSAVVLRIHRDAIDAELTLPIGELAVGWDKPLPPDAVAIVEQYGEELKDYVRAHVRPIAPDGRPWTVAVGEVAPVVEQEPDVRVSLKMTPPPGAPVDRLTFGYDAIFHRLVTHRAVVSLAGDWRNGVTADEPVILGTMRDTDVTLVVDRSGGGWFRGFAAMFRLGVRHIAEGTDHLLFLLALILPAPLVAEGWRWGGYAGVRTALRRIVEVVTAFTVGHSITLVVGALGWARLPDALVESAIALSIFISAVHALVPIFRGREVYIAGGFGLVHGLAFAATLDGFGLDPWTLALTVLGFNLGIEAFQILVVLATMPWLVLLARTRVYGPLRTAGAVFTGIAAAAWFAERAFDWPNPIGPLVEGVAAHGVWLLVGLIALAVAAGWNGRRELVEPAGAI
ncbi:HupE/UreJ family protein [Paludisphaera rhizosphaerae]|uniref:HupE/UreJ family protein n=1 Tax=Paludisphaera rhizosphaerae TaxID=2711216 RepID=UPI0013EE2832|nr:HupE/UreJ family protein [Paludisphaera rhizosphaerae]